AFRWAHAVLGDEMLFRRHAEARALIGYIQQDEAPHVGYLATALAELRCRELAGENGEPVPGRLVVDRARDLIVGFQTGPRHRAPARARSRGRGSPAPPARPPPAARPCWRTSEPRDERVPPGRRRRRAPRADRTPRGHSGETARREVTTSCGLPWSEFAMRRK